MPKTAIGAAAFLCDNSQDLDQILFRIGGEMEIPDPSIVESCRACESRYAKYGTVPCSYCNNTGLRPTGLGQELMELFEGHMLPVIRELVRKEIAEQKGGC